MWRIFFNLMECGTVAIATNPRLSSEQRRELILEAAMNLFAERGYDAVGVRDLAAEAGLSAPGIYRHFSSKEEILTRIFDRLADRLSDAVRSADRVADPEAALESLIAAHIHESIHHSKVLPILYFMLDRLSPDEREWFRKVSRSYLDAWVGRLRELRPELGDRAAKVSVHAVFGLLNSLGHHHVRLPERSLASHLTTMVRAALGLQR